MQETTPKHSSAKSILRVSGKPTHYVKKDSQAIKDPLLSFTASGIHDWAMSQSPEWELHMNSMVAAKKSSRYHTRMALYELESHGYAMSMRPIGGKGRTRIVIAETKEVMRQFFLDNPDLTRHYYQQAIKRKGFSFATPPPCAQSKPEHEGDCPF